MVKERNMPLPSVTVNERFLRARDRALEILKGNQNELY